MAILDNLPYSDRDRTYLPDDPANPNYDPSYVPPDQETEQTPNGDEPGPGTADNDPWDTAPADGNWQAWFQRNIQGTPATPAALAALEAKLAKHGIKVLRNAQGIPGKIELPNGGGIIDVGIGFSSGDPSLMSWGWQVGGADGGETTPIEIDPSYLEAFDEEFVTPERGELPPDFTYAEFEGFDPFVAPDSESVLKDPGYQFRRDQGQGMLETSAAARGVLNTGGTLKDLIGYGQQMASQEYGNVWNRDFSTWDQNQRNKLTAYDTNRTNALGNFGVNYGLSTDSYKRAWDQYLERRNTHWGNQNNAWAKVRDAASIGAGAAASS